MNAYIETKFTVEEGLSKDKAYHRKSGTPWSARR
jgi:hypothetical protein